MQPIRRDTFDRIWKQMARDGFCDALDSREYQRIKHAWRTLGKPVPIRTFICYMANAPVTRLSFSVN